MGHTLAYSGILWHTLANPGILWHTLAYSGILWHTLANSGILWHALAYSGIINASLITADGAYHCPLGSIMAIFSSVRSSYSHPDLLVTHHQHPLFQITLVLNTGLSLSEPLQLYKGYNAKGNHWTRCAGFMDASWVRLGITDDD